jgi:hypothetical protein
MYIYVADGGGYTSELTVSRPADSQLTCRGVITQ